MELIFVFIAFVVGLVVGKETSDLTTIDYQPYTAGELLQALKLASLRTYYLFGVKPTDQELNNAARMMLRAAKKGETLEQNTLEFIDATANSNG